MYDWTGDIGPGIPVNKSYGDIVRYWCEKEGWGYPSNGLSEMYAVCQANKMWNLTEVDKCMCKFFDLSITLCCLFIVVMANSDKLEMTPIIITSTIIQYLFVYVMTLPPNLEENMVNAFEMAQVKERTSNSFKSLHKMHRL